MNEEFKQKLFDILKNNEELIDNWLKLVDENEQDIQHRYYDDFLGFFGECLENNLHIGTEEYDAMVSFLEKLSQIIGDDKFFNFRHCHYMAYLPLPIIEALEGTEFFTSSNIKKINVFFESITSKIMLDIIQKQNDFKQASTAELEEREAPLSEIWDGIIMVSIVGTLDSNRILNIIDKILSRLEFGDIHHVVIDIGAIFDMNSEVANQIIKLNQAISFMGVKAYLSGITKNIARSLTHLDISLGDIKTFNKTKIAIKAIISES